MISVLAVTLALAGMAAAQGPGNWGGPPAGGPEMMESGHGDMGGPGGLEQLERFRMLFRQLDLSQDQIDQIRTIVDDAREEVRNLMEDARPQDDAESFMDVFTSPDLTVSDLENLTAGMDEVREQAREIVLQAMVDIHDVLTTEQLQKLAEIAQQHMGGGPGMGPGAGMGSGPEMHQHM